MNKRMVTMSITSLAVFVLGLLLLLSLVGWIDSASVYATALPVLLILAGFSLFTNSSDERRNRSLGLGFLGFGLVALLVRFNILNGDAVNTIVGIVLVVSGVISGTKIYDGLKTSKISKQEPANE